MKAGDTITDKIKFCLGTASSNLDLSDDIKLIKSSILYADEVQLLGMVEYAIFQYLENFEGNVADVYSLYDYIMPLLKSIPNSEESISQLNEMMDLLKPYEPILRKKKRRNREELLAQMNMKKAEREIQKLMTDAIKPFQQTPNAEIIRSLMARNIVTYKPYPVSKFNLDNLVGNYIANLFQAMQDATSFPLFDAQSSEIVASSLGIAKIDVSNTKAETLRHAGIATNILMTLPTLENAEFDELLDLKRDLSIPLNNFRNAIFTYSGKISSLPWDKDFEYDCLKLYYTDVVPNLQEINELATETSVIKNLGRRVLADETIRKEAGFMTGGLATVVTSSTSFANALQSLETIFRTIGTISLSTASVLAALKGLHLFLESKKEVHESQVKVENNVMYFYHKVNEELGK